MTPSPQQVRTRGPARPRNIAVGVLSVAVVITFLLLVGWFVRRSGPDLPRDAETPAAPQTPAIP